MYARGRIQRTHRRRTGAISHQAQPLAASGTQGAMSNIPEGTVVNPVVEIAHEGGGDDGKEEIEKVVDLRTCHPKPNRQSFVRTRRIFLLDPQQRTMCASCSVLMPCPKGNTANLITSRQENIKKTTSSSIRQEIS